jgi:hypothetical protein
MNSLIIQDRILSVPIPKKKPPRNHKTAIHHVILGHSMQIKQFNHPVYCAICSRFVWYLKYF